MDDICLTAVKIFADLNLSQLVEVSLKLSMMFHQNDITMGSVYHSMLYKTSFFSMHLCEVSEEILYDPLRKKFSKSYAFFCSFLKFAQYWLNL